MSTSLRRWLPALTLAVGLCSSITALAQPGNNDCATVAGGGFDVPATGGSVNGTTALATVDGDCTCDGGTAGRDVYYRFTPATSGLWRFSLCGGTTIDTVVSVHSGCPANGGTQLACDDDSCGGIGVLSAVNANLSSGTTYIIRVGMWSSFAAGGAFTLNVSPVVALTNDNCSTVVAAAASIPGAGGTVTGTTTGASNDGDCSCDDGDPGALDVYFKFIPNATGPWQFSLCTGTTIDTAMSIHSGCPADISTELACDDDGCGVPDTGVPSELTLTLTSGTTYIVRVAMWDSFNTVGGPFTLTVANFSTAGACCSTTTAACTISPSGAAGCASGTTFQGAGSLCSPSPCPQEACCDTVTGVCTIAGPGTCPSGSTGQGTGSSCVPYPCPAPPNDECGAANPAVTVGVPAIGSNIGATASGALTNTGSGSCTQASFNTGTHLDVWYRFVPPATGTYNIDTCGSTMPDTLISIHSACPADQTNIVDCNDDAILSPCSNSGLNSRISSVLLTAGQTYFIGVAGFDGASGAFVLNVNPVQSGACCNNTSGACTTSLSGAAGCGVGTTYQGDNSTCSPSPCAQEACCNTATGACTLSVPGGCASGTTGQGSGTTCTPNPCPQEACCNPATGGCVIAATGACPSGSTGQGNGTTCTPNPCPQPPPPANDLCADAVNLNSVATFPGTPYVQNGSSTTATNDGVTPDEGACNAGAGEGLDNSVWHRWTPASSGTLQIQVSTSSNDFDILMVVYTGTDCASLVELADPTCGGDGTNGLPDDVNYSIHLDAGTTYYFGLGDWGTFDVGGPYTLTLTFVSDTPAGVCCRGATCSTTVTSSAACTSSLIGGQLAGASFPAAASCNAGAISNTPCCYADFNKTGGVTVSDIFDFLNDWFAGSPYANTGGNGSPGPLAVQNIFDFLTNWFAGGC